MDKKQRTGAPGPAWSGSRAGTGRAAAGAGRAAGRGRGGTCCRTARTGAPGGGPAAAGGGPAAAGWTPAGTRTAAGAGTARGDLPGARGRGGLPELQGRGGAGSGQAEEWALFEERVEVWQPGAGPGAGPRTGQGQS